MNTNKSVVREHGRQKHNRVLCGGKGICSLRKESLFPVAEGIEIHMLHVGRC
jgi:hypothetical protein